MEEKALEMVDRFKTIKTLPQIVTRLTMLLNDEASTIDDFERLVRTDPALVARLLTLINSSSVGLSKRIDSISRAVGLLGVKNLHNLAMSDAVQTMLRSSPAKSTFFPETLWSHSVASGICGKMLAERIFSLNGDNVYLCGILHDIGMIVELYTEEDLFLQFYSQLEEGSTILELEDTIIGTNHSMLGYMLTKEWCLPSEISTAICNHHDTVETIEPSSPVALIQLSEFIISKLGFSLKEGYIPHLPLCLQKHIQDNIDEYTILTEDLPEEIEAAIQIYNQ